MRNDPLDNPSRLNAVREALKLVSDGMTIGLGTGSTTSLFIRELALRVKKEKLRLDFFASSFATVHLAKSLGLTVLESSALGELDVSFDGADEVDPALHLIKGGGAAHTREKILHAASRAFYCLVDETKRVSVLGERTAVPLEVLPMARSPVIRKLQDLGAMDVELRLARMKDGPVVTDNGNLILDAKLPLADPPAMEESLARIPGVVESGIFALPHCHLAGVFVGSPDGVVYLKKEI
ncbi:MAG: ribose-5-phosphate isomerase RpiA [Spirochaetales bacterium]|nr:ribose-5-phosphate isomerase RpiA [Spirochaetales bacterium]